MADTTSIRRRSTATAYKPSPVSPVSFAAAMRAHWENLGNATSDKLMELWTSMGSAFSRAILVGSGSLKGERGEQHQWQVLQPPTGTGKTQGACVYAAIVAEANRELGEKRDKTGMLFVTRRIEEADKLAATINNLAGADCAIARHSENRISVQEMARHDVLIVTHQAYVNALEDVVLEHGDSRLHDFLSWDAGPRFLTVIDESLSALVKSYRATEEDFRLVAAQFDQKIASEFPWLVADFKQVANSLSKMVALFDEFDPQEATETKRLWSDARTKVDWQFHRKYIPALRRTMATMPYDRVLLARDDPSARRAYAERVDRTLGVYEAIGLGAAYRSGTGGKLTVHTSQLLLPKELPGPVILDATAEQEPIWELLGRRVQIAEKVEDVRNYKNVTLHVAWGRAIGKTGMNKNAEERLSRLLDNLKEPLGGRRVFLCLHKDLEARAATYVPGFAEYSIDHWGNVDGRNDWQKYDAAVLFGLLYRPNTWAIDMLQAVRQIETTGEILSIRGHAKRKRLKESLQTGQITAAVIQAINRIRCRRVVDDHGNCSDAVVYITLPRDKAGSNILSRIKREMPGIEVVDWAFDLDGEEQLVSRAHYAEPVVSFMENHPPGEIRLKELCEQLGLSKNAKKDMQDDFRDPDNPLTLKLNEMGVFYHSTGRGRGARSYLLKR